MIVVATPTRGQVEATFASDLVQLIKRSPEADWATGLGSIISNNRTLLVHTAAKAKASHILFIDSDMRFPPDALERLLKHKKDIIGANYRQRTQAEWTARNNDAFITSKDRTGLEQVDSLGFGLVLIDMNVFNSKLRAMPSNAFAMPFDNSTGIFVGEDVYFCAIAKDLGYKIYIDHDLSQEVRHTGSIEYGVN